LHRFSPVSLPACAYWSTDMSDPLSDPLLLGQRVVAVLETGLRTATYKLASLMALIDHCIEHLPDNPRDTLLVPIPDLAHRVLEIYWRQVRPFEGQELRQSTQPRARILIAASTFRSSAGCNASLEVAIVRAPAAYATAIDEITLCLAQQPLHRLQRLPEPHRPRAAVVSGGNRRPRQSCPRLRSLQRRQAELAARCRYCRPSPSPRSASAGTDCRRVGMAHTT
jgi:hypothetical protein